MGSSLICNLLLFLIFSLILGILTTICLGVVLHGLTLFETLCFLRLDVCFLSQLRKVFSYVFKYVLCLFCSFISIWYPCNKNVSLLGVVSEVCQTALSFYSFFLLSSHDFHYSVFQLSDPFVSMNLLLIQSSIFHFSCCFLYLYLVNVFFLLKTFNFWGRLETPVPDTKKGAVTSL